MSDPFDAESNESFDAFDAGPSEAPGPVDPLANVPTAPLMGSDKDAVKKINQRSSMVTKVVAGAIVLAGAGGAVMAYQHNAAHSTRMETLEQVCAPMENGTQEKLTCIRDVLREANFDDVKSRALRNLGAYQDVGAVELISSQLDTPGPVRRDAAWALARIGAPDAASAVAKLLEVLPETGEVDRNQVVWTLAVLGADTEPAKDAIIQSFAEGRLSSIEGFDPRVMTNALGLTRLASEELTNHEEEHVRRATAQALAEDASEQAIAPLARMLQNELARERDERSAEVIRAAASGLGRTGDARAAQPLFAALQSDPGLQDMVLTALEQSTAAPDLAVLLGEAQDTGVRQGLVDIIARAHDRRVTDTLVSLLEDGELENRKTAALALARFGESQSKGVLYELANLEDGDDDTISTALEQLRFVVDESDVERLAPMMESHFYRQAAVLRALGATQSPRAERILLDALQNGEDPPVAAHGLALVDSDSAYRTLLGMVVRPRNVEMYATNAAERSLSNEDLLRRRRGAIRAMAIFGRATALPDLMEVVEDDMDDYELRAAAAASIGQIANADELRQVVGKIGNSQVSEAAQGYYVQSLWQRPHRALNGAMLDMMANDSLTTPVRRAAALAVGYAADPDNDARLEAMLDDESARRNAAIAIALGGGRAAVEKLVDVLMEDGDTLEILNLAIGSESNDWFNLLTDEMFESGAVWRRIRAAQILRRGQGERGFSQAWAKTLSVLKTGWNGPRGLRSQEILDRLWSTGVESDQESRRLLALEVFAELPETGLLLRARDEGGELGELARDILRGARE